uniref:Mpv17-like protein n=1 Tax=Strombidium rassoulzadegani TaxID=1082188 RepID=A0A7S3FWA6_9SPIT|mmetsp:Transcript_13844/g.23615  ORF Transcript_13844/g.23615 Transcript_13844/m.23615 type:complete len:197 (+) Transcript_13844:27-617(+)|eukprot:CAMPEP_0168617220 /NCGR_PEP_ID=MMETSP0449_2-20121227/5432_1 /TAXON_ID=1082188 /ORGANISM="Strombidium rassoulzadegani, Strain ras09" /LENGTH=196 /DNA_ID=CAMNT_0008658033 /DNA_START=14 /DNA_END=604 /DNA_ORIENTATION=+
MGFRKFFNWYSLKLETNPLLTKSLTCGALNMVGDTLSQTLEKRVKPEKREKGFDFKRNLIFGAIGSFYIAPLLHVHYSKFLPYVVPDGTKYGALKKLAIDQSAFASFITTGFFIIINVVEGKGAQKGIDDLKQKYWTTMVINWKIWIPANYMNFVLIPNKYQVLFANFIQIFYNTALSFIHNSDDIGKKEDQPKQA